MPGALIPEPEATMPTIPQRFTVALTMRMAIMVFLFSPSLRDAKTGKTFLE